MPTTSAAQSVVMPAWKLADGKGPLLNLEQEIRCIDGGSDKCVGLRRTCGGECAGGCDDGNGPS